MYLKADTREFLQLAQAFEAAQVALMQSRPTLLRALGVQMLSWGFQDYREKSRGSIGGDGVAWSPIKPETIKGRIRKLKAYKNKSASVKNARLRIVAAKTKVRVARSSVRLAKIGTKQHTKAVAKLKQAKKQVATSKGRLTKAKTARQKYLAPHLENSRIGIDTGRLTNSLLYGVPEIKTRPVTGNAVKPGDEPTQPAVFLVDHSSVTVGTNMSYAKYFDEDRPIFGPGFLNAARQVKLSNLAAKAVRIIIRQAAERKLPQQVKDIDIANSD